MPAVARARKEGDVGATRDAAAPPTAETLSAARRWSSTRTAPVARGAHARRLEAEALDARAAARGDEQHGGADGAAPTKWTLDAGLVAADRDRWPACAVGDGDAVVLQARGARGLRASSGGGSGGGVGQRLLRSGGTVLRRRNRRGQKHGMTYC